MTAVQRFLERFDRKTPTGGQWLVKCPAHQDTTASLAVREGADGRVLLKCHAGCQTQSIVASMGLAESDLFDKPTITASPTRRIVAEYDYRDERLELLYQTVRYEPKDFRQRRPDGNGGWIWNLEGVRRVLYRFAELKGVEGVAIVEGEKDVETLRAIAIPATCNVGGAGKWRPEYAKQLIAQGVKRVRILPDHDVSGHAHAETIARSCYKAGLDVKIVKLPCLLPKGDVSDFLAAGHTKAEISALANTAPAYTPTPSPTTTTVAPSGIQFTSLSDLLTEPDDVVKWVVQDRIPAGGLLLLAGKPKAGKSTLVRDLALQVAKGGQWLGFPCTPGLVWYLAFEDKRSEVRKHFRQMGGTGKELVRFIFPQPVEHLITDLRAFAEAERPTLIVVDTLQRLIGARDMNDYAEIIDKLTPLLEIARETAAAVLLVHHAGKGERAGVDAPLGSTALAGSVDNMFIYSRTERYRLLSTIQRIGADLTESVIELNETTGRVKLGATRHNADVAEMKAAMLAALQARGEPMTEPALGKDVEGRGTVKREALRSLLAEGTVVRVGAGKRGDPFRYSVSCSLVPLQGREQETEKSKLAETTNKQASDSRSGQVESLAVPPEAKNEKLAPQPSPDADVFEVA